MTERVLFVLADVTDAGHGPLARGSDTGEW